MERTRNRRQLLLCFGVLACTLTGSAVLTGCASERGTRGVPFDAGSAPPKADAGVAVELDGSSVPADARAPALDASSPPQGDASSPPQEDAALPPDDGGGTAIELDAAPADASIGETDAGTLPLEDASQPDSPDSGSQDASVGCECEQSNNPCIRTLCTDEGCREEPVAAGRPARDPAQLSGDCRAVVCDGAGGAYERPDDDPPAPDECTQTYCVWGQPRQSDLPAGTRCGSGVCSRGSCFPSLCVNGEKDPGETDRDCGGYSCPKCDLRRSCRDTSDCARGQCIDFVCQVLDCADGVRSMGESDVDCGGSCEPCALGQHCWQDADCALGLCTSGRCGFPGCNAPLPSAATASGSCEQACGGCVSGQACQEDSDCLELFNCTNGKCADRAGTSAYDAQVGAAALARDPTDGTVYVSVPGDGIGAPGRVLAYAPGLIEPAWALEVDAVPGPLAVNDAGTLLFVGLDGNPPTIAQINLQTRQVEQAFPLGSVRYYGAVRATGIDVRPGSLDTLAVVGEANRSDVGIRIYRSGQLLFPTSDYVGDWAQDRNAVLGLTITTATFAGPDTLFGHNGANTGAELAQVQLTEQGMRVQAVLPDAVAPFHGLIHATDSRVYLQSKAFAADDMHTLGTFPVPGPMAIADHARRVYVVDDRDESYGVDPGTIPSAYAVHCFDPETYARSGSFWIDSQVAPPDLLGTPTEVELWGAEGLAVRTRAENGRLSLILLPDALARVPGCAAEQIPRATPPSIAGPDAQSDEQGLEVYYLNSNQHRIDAETNTIYLTLNSSDPRLPNTLAALRTDGSGIAWSTPVGSEPGPLDLSTDGSTMWVGLEGASSLIPVDIASRAAGAPYAIDNDPTRGAARILSVQALPGLPGSVVVSGINLAFDGFEGLDVFDWGVRRGAPLEPFPTIYGDVDEVVVTGPGHVYGIGDDLLSIALSDEHASLLWRAPKLLSYPARYSSGTFFDGNGRLFEIKPEPDDAQSPPVRLLGTAPGIGQTIYGDRTSVHRGQHAYLAYLTDPLQGDPIRYTIQCFDTRTYTKTGKIDLEIPTPPSYRGPRLLAIDLFGADSMLLRFEEFVVLAHHVLGRAPGCAPDAQMPAVATPDGFDLSASRDAVLTLAVAANGLFPSRDLSTLYVSVGARDPRYANQVIAIPSQFDGEFWAFRAGSDPAAMDLMSDDRTLLIGSYGSSEALAIDLETRDRRVGLAVPVGDRGARRPTGFAVAPDSGLVAVRTESGDNIDYLSPDQALMTKYDAPSMSLTVLGRLGHSAEDVTFSDPYRAWVADGWPIWRDFDANGAEVGHGDYSVDTNSHELVGAAGGLVLAGDGTLFDAGSGVVTGKLTVGALGEWTERAAWLLLDDGKYAVAAYSLNGGVVGLSCFDTENLTELEIARLRLPAALDTGDNEVVEVARWGTDGVAARNLSDQLIAIPHALGMIPSCRQ